MDRRVRLPEQARQAEIQLDLIYDHRTNLAAYLVRQQWLRKIFTKLLITSRRQLRDVLPRSGYEATPEQ